MARGRCSAMVPPGVRALLRVAAALALAIVSSGDSSVGGLADSRGGEELFVASAYCGAGGAELRCKDLAVAWDRAAQRWQQEQARSDLPQVAWRAHECFDARGRAGRDYAACKKRSALGTLFVDFAVVLPDGGLATTVHYQGPLTADGLLDFVRGAIGFPDSISGSSAELGGSGGAPAEADALDTSMASGGYRYKVVSFRGGAGPRRGPMDAAFDIAAQAWRSKTAGADSETSEDEEPELRALWWDQRECFDAKWGHGRDHWLCTRHGVSSFPKVRLLRWSDELEGFDDASAVDYAGMPSAEDITRFVREGLGLPSLASGHLPMNAEGEEGATSVEGGSAASLLSDTAQHLKESSASDAMADSGAVKSSDEAENEGSMGSDSGMLGGYVAQGETTDLEAATEGALNTVSPLPGEASAMEPTLEEGTMGVAAVDSLANGEDLGGRMSDDIGMVNSMRTINPEQAHTNGDAELSTEATEETAVETAAAAAADIPVEFDATVPNLAEETAPAAAVETAEAAAVHIAPSEVGSESGDRDIAKEADGGGAGVDDDLGASADGEKVDGTGDVAPARRLDHIPGATAPTGFPIAQRAGDFGAANGRGHGPESDQHGLDKPSGVFEFGGQVYVSDTWNHRVQRWNVSENASAPPMTGTVVTVAGGLGPGQALNQLRYPKGIFVDASGRLFVADAGNHRVVRWDPGAVQGVVVGGSYGLIRDKQGTVIGQEPHCCRAGAGAMQLRDPQGVFVNSSGFLFVADTGNGRIQGILGASATTVAGAAGAGAAVNATLLRPAAIFVHAAVVYVADTGHDRVLAFPTENASTGSLVAGGHGRGNGSAQLVSPSGVWVEVGVDAGASVTWLFVSDTYNHRVMRYRLGGDFDYGATIVAGDCLQNPYYISPCFKGGLHYPFDPSLDRVDQLNPARDNPPFYYLWGPSQIYVSQGGANVTIADTNNHRVMTWFT